MQQNRPTVQRTTVPHRLRELALPALETGAAPAPLVLSKTRFKLALQQLHQRETEVSVSIVGLYPQRLVEACCRLLQLAEVAVHNGEVVVRLRRFGLERDRAPEADDRLVQPLLVT